MSGPQLKIKNQIMAYCWTFENGSLKLVKILWAMHYGVTMDPQKKSFIEPGESCPHWLKITSWNELGRLVHKYRIAI